MGVNEGASLTEILCAHLDFQGASAPALEQRLDRLWTRASASWPEVNLSAGAFLAHLARQIPSSTEVLLVLDQVHAPDLYLACACLEGNSHAVATLENHFLKNTWKTLGSVASGAFLDEVKQEVRQSLFMTHNDAPPKISRYSGLGPLGAWLRVVALRTAISLRRKEQKAPLADDDLFEIPAPTSSPELDFLKESHRQQFKQAFEGALSKLSSRERNVLRLYFLDHLKEEQIALIYRVHLSSVSRWIASARETLFENTARALKEELKLDERELASLVSALVSQIDLSLRKFLGDSPE